MNIPLSDRRPMPAGSNPVRGSAAAQVASSASVLEPLHPHPLRRSQDFARQEVNELLPVAVAEHLISRSDAIRTRDCQRLRDLNALQRYLASAANTLSATETRLAQTLDVLSATEAALRVSESDRQRAELLSLRDPTTGLPNRRMFDDRFEHALTIADRYQWTLAVMFLDLDRFKVVNDSLGHAVGDQVLKEVARRLMAHTRDEDSACRNGGDEFLFLLVNPQGRDNIVRIVNAILASTAHPVNTGAAHVAIGASVGISIFPEDGLSVEDLINKADTAMYRAKNAKAGHAFFSAVQSKSTSVAATAAIKPAVIPDRMGAQPDFGGADHRPGQDHALP